MASDEQVNLILNATGWVNGANDAAKASGILANSIEILTTEFTDFERNGNNITPGKTVETFRALTAEGEVLSGVLQKVAGESEVTRVSLNRLANANTKSAQQEANNNRTLIRSINAVSFEREKAARKAIASQGIKPSADEALALNLARSRLAEVGAQAGLTGQDIETLFARFKDGTLSSQRGLDEVKRAVQAVDRAEQALGNTFVKESKKVAAAEAKKVVEVERTNAALLRQKNAADIQGGLERRSRLPSSNASPEEANALRNAQETLREVAAEAGKTDADVKKLFADYEAGAIKSGDATRRLVQAIKAVKNAEAALGAEAKKQSDAAIKAQEKKNLAIRKTAEALRLEKNSRAIDTALQDRKRSVVGRFVTVSPDENANITSAQIRLRDLAVAANKTAADVRKLFTDYEAGVLDSTKETKGLIAALQALKKAETAAGDAAQKAFDKETAARKERNAEIRKGIKEEGKGRIGANIDASLEARGNAVRAAALPATPDEGANLARAQIKVRELAVEAGKTNAQLKKMLLDYQNGVLKSTSETKKLEAGIQGLAKAEREVGAVSRKEARERDKELNKQLVEVERLIGAEAELIALKSAVGRIRAATRQGVNLSSGTNLQQKQFLTAENALIKLRRTNKVASGEILSSLARANAGTLRLANAYTAVDRAALRVVSATKAIAQNANIARKTVGGLAASVVDLTKLIGISLAIGSAFRFAGLIEESIGTVAELSIKIAELQTIQDTTNLSTQEWLGNLRQLSEAFGISTIDQAEGAYQALSNQIIKSAEDIRFLQAANRLAITGLTDTGNAVNLLTSALKSFNLPVSSADEVSAKLFKTVELGRVRVEELADTFGRLAVPANQLGVSLDELQAAIAFTTIRGVKFSEASTLIRNILLKLIRPTDELKDTLASMGFATGEAAINTLGLGGTLRALEGTTGGSTTELGNLFGRIRAITGALIFASDETGEFESTLETIQQTSIADFLEKTNLVLQSTGQQLKIAGEQARNFFEVRIGDPVIEKVVELIKRLGGMNNILAKSADVLELVGKTTAAVALATVGTAALVASASVATMTAAVSGLFAVLNAPVGLAGALAATITIGSVLAQQEAAERERILVEGLKKENDLRKAAVAEAATIIEFETKAVKDAFVERTRLAFQAIQARTKLLNEEQATAKTNLEQSTRAFTSFNTRLSTTLTNLISTSSKSVKRLQKDGEEAAKAVSEIFNETGQDVFKFEFDNTGLQQQLALVERSIAQATADQTAARERGDVAGFNTARKELKKSVDQQIKLQLEISKTRKDIEIEIANVKDKLERATTSKEREKFARELKRLKTISDIRINASKAQLKVQEAIATLESKGIGDGGLKQKDQDGLKGLQLEQAKLNALVEEERILQNKKLDIFENQRKALESLRNEDAARVRLGIEQENRLRAASFLFTLLNKQSNTFKLSAFEKAKTDAEVLKLNNQQQTVLGRILAVQRELGLGADAERVIRERSVAIQTAADNKRQRIREATSSQILKDQKRIFKAALDQTKDLRKAETERSGAFKASLTVLTDSLDAFVTKGKGAFEVDAGRQIFRARSIVETGSNAASVPPNEIAAVNQEFETLAERAAAASKSFQAVKLEGSAENFSTLDADLDRLKTSLASFENLAALDLTGEDEELANFISSIKLATGALLAFERGQPEDKKNADLIKKLDAQNRALLEAEKVTKGVTVEQKVATAATAKMAEALKTAQEALKKVAQIQSGPPEASQATPGIVVVPKLLELTTNISDAFEPTVVEKVIKRLIGKQLPLGPLGQDAPRRTVVSPTKRQEQTVTVNTVPLVNAFATGSKTFGRDAAKFFTDAVKTTDDKASKTKATPSTEALRREARRRRGIASTRRTPDKVVQRTLPDPVDPKDIQQTQRQGGVLNVVPFVPTRSTPLLTRDDLMLEAAKEQKDIQERLLAFQESQADNKESERAAEELKKALPGIQKGIVKGVDTARGKAARAAGNGAGSPGESGAAKALKEALASRDALREVTAKDIKSFQTASVETLKDIRDNVLPSKIRGTKSPIERSLLREELRAVEKKLNSLKPAQRDTEINEGRKRVDFLKSTSIGGEALTKETARLQALINEKRAVALKLTERRIALEKAGIIKAAPKKIPEGAITVSPGQTSPAPLTGKEENLIKVEGYAERFAQVAAQAFQKVLRPVVGGVELSQPGDNLAGKSQAVKNAERANAFDRATQGQLPVLRRIPVTPGTNSRGDFSPELRRMGGGVRPSPNGGVTNITNIPKIDITVVESKDPNASANAVMGKIKQARRQGRFK